MSESLEIKIIRNLNKQLDALNKKITSTLSNESMWHEEVTHMVAVQGELFHQLLAITNDDFDLDVDMSEIDSPDGGPADDFERP